MPIKILENDKLSTNNTNILQISNCSGIWKFFEKILNRFDKMYKSRSFLHWYFYEGMELKDFEEGRDTFVNDIMAVGINLIPMDFSSDED